MTSSTRVRSWRRPLSQVAVPPTGLVLLAVTSVQLGSAIAKHLFTSLGPGGAAMMRVGFAAIVLIVLWRPQLRGRRPRQLALAALFGLTIAVMNFTFYLALDRIPLGTAVTLEFVGPLAVAVAGSRRPRDVVWVVLAATGILLLSPWSGAGLNPGGVSLALFAGACWASYILLSQRVGLVFPGTQGLAIALAVGSIVLIPVGIASAGTHLLLPQQLAGGLVVGLLSGVIPYSLELEALRRLPARVFGVLMSLEPAVAAVFGFLVLGEVLGPRAVVALILVSIASLGASREAEGKPVLD